MAIETGRLLRLRVRARPFVSAVATFRVYPCEPGCVLTLEEEPTARLIGNMVRPVLDPLTHLRNHRSLRRLADLLASTSRQRVVSAVDDVVIGDGPNGLVAANDLADAG